MDLAPRERAARGLKLLEAGILGPRNGPVRHDPEAIEIMFDTIRRQADPSAVRPGTVVQWDFADEQPWYLRCDNGHTSVSPGRAEHADLTLRSSFDDFADVVGGRADPRVLVLKRRLKPSGDPRVLLRLPRLLG
jgi:predicted lipid carrier protein YhbT